jgi:phenylacetate-CoA ligase
MILGYANALRVYAEYLNEHRPDHRIRPAGIISSAEKLTESTRRIVQSAFGCKVLNRYGSREVGLIASECDRQEGLHINSDNLLLEILDGESAVETGTSGDIVITDFTNFGMPFIRYKMQDRGRLGASACSCGRGLPLLEAVEGREADFFVAANGDLVHGEYFTHLFYGIPQVTKFQMIQESIDEVQLKIVESASGPGDREYVGFIQQKVHEMLGEQAELTTTFVDEIPPPASGKHIFTISRIKRPV